MRGWRSVRTLAAPVGVLLLVAAEPLGAEDEKTAEAPSCEAPGAVERVRGLEGIVDRAIRIEAGRVSASGPAAAVVLNGRGYNYGPALVTAQPAVPPPPR